MLTEMFLPFATSREDAPAVTRVKGTWLVSSIRTLRAQGHFAKYEVNLEASAKERVLQLTPQEWLPAAYLDAHYMACETLELPGSEAYALGFNTLKHSHQSVLAMTARLAQAGGVTPWSVFSQFHKMWGRSFVGGDIEILKIGPKEARVEVLGLGCGRFRYCRNGIRGVLAGMAELFCGKAYVNEVAWRSTDTSLVLRIAWA